MRFILRGVCRAMRPVVEGKGLLGIEFDRVKQHVCASQFSSQTGGKDLASPPKTDSILKPIGFIQLARIALGKPLWQLARYRVTTCDVVQS